MGRRPHDTINQPLHLLRRTVIPYHTDKNTACAQSTDISSHIGSPTQSGALARYTQDRDRGFRRNSLNLPFNEPVQHHIADTQHSRCAYLLQNGRKIGISHWCLILSG